MNIIKGIILTGIAGLCAQSSVMAITPEEYISPRVKFPKSIKEMRPLADGVTYAAVSDDGKSIDVYSYQTGKKISTLFSVDNIKGDVKIQDFDGYTLSGNEKKILLWNNTEKIYRRSFYADYYVYDVLRSTLARVSENGSQRGALLSHDGRMVAYTRGNNIYISNLDYNTDRAITTDGKTNEIIYGVPDWSYEEEFSIVNTMRWSDDDNTLAFIRFDEREVPTYTFDNVKSYCDSKPLSDPYPSAYSYKYPLAGYPNSSVSVMAYNLDNRTTKTMQLPYEGAYIPSMEFDGEGKNLMIMMLNRDQNHLTLYSVNPGSTIAHPLLTETSEAWLNPSAYQMVEYGRSSFVIGSERSGYRHLYEYDYSGNLLRQITKGDFNVTDYYGKDKLGNYYVQTTSLGAVNRNVGVVGAKTGLKLLHGEPGYESCSFSRDFSYYVRRYTNISTPQQYTLWSIKGKKISDLELNGEYAAKYASAPKMELLKVKNAAGEEMDAYIIKPLDFDPTKRYPLLMHQYNGPDSQTVENKWTMDGCFYLASKGYIVAAVDGRGTGNRSRQWATSVYRRLGQLETEDQIAGAKYFASLPYIDSDKIACFGWSYGGYMTLMELSAKDCPFKCGIAMAPVTDWRFYDSIYTERYMTTPQQNEKGYDIASALNRTQDMKAKLLIMSGTSDDNVHFYNTLKYTSKLNYEGTLFDMMAYTGFEHSLPMCNAREMLYLKIEEFLNTHLR